MLTTKSQKFRSISRRLIVYVILFSSVITLLTTTAQLYIEYSRDVDNIGHHFTQVEKGYLRQIEAAVWHLDRERAQLEVEGIQSLADITYVAVTSDGVIFATSGIANLPKKTLVREYGLTHQDPGNTTRIGHLQVVADLSAVYQRLYSRVGTILGANALKTFLVALFIAFLFESLVTRHLRDLGEAAGNMTMQNLDTPLLLNRPTSENGHYDELDQLLATANTMREELGSTLKKVTSINASMRAAQELAHMGNWSWRLSTSTVTWSPEIYRIFGFEPDEVSVTARLFLTMVHKEDRHVILQAASTGLKSRKKQSMDYRIVTQQGVIRHLHAEGRFALDPETRGAVMTGTLQDLTNRILAEQALRHNESQLSEAQAIAHLGHWERDIHADHVTWSDEVFRIYGYKPQSFQPTMKRFFAMIHADDRRTVLQSFRDSVHENTEEEFRIVRPDGTVRTVYGTSRVEGDNTTNSQKIFGIVTDITERRRAEDLLQERQQQYRDLIDGSIQGIVIIRDYKALFANQTMADILGMDSPDQLTAMKNVLPLVAPHHHELAIKYTQSWMDDDDSLANTYEFDAIRADGAIITLENIGRRITWKGEKALQCTYIEITERKQAQQSLEKSRASLQEAQRIAHLGSWEWSFSTQKMTWEEETYRLFGYTPGEVEAGYAAFIARVHPDDQARMQKTVVSATEKYESYDAEFRALMPDGSEKHMHAFGHVTFATGGTPKTLLGTIQDISDRKAAEQTRELAFANRKLSELDELKSMFIASMSHELRTPLNSIIGFTSVLLQGLSGELNKEQHSQLKRVHSSSQHLLDLITDVIDISKIEAGKIDSHAEDIVVSDVVHDAVAMVQSMADDKGLIVSTESQPELTMVSDRKRVFQCVLNLLSNAVKYTPAGTVDISTASDAKYVQFVISDTGIGMDQNAVNTLFQPFVRIDSELRTRVGGTGLGLYLTQKLVTETLGGTLAVQSIPDKGSVFTLTLPRQIPAIQPTHALTVPEELPGTTDMLQMRITELEQTNRRLTQLDAVKFSFFASMSHELRTPMNAILGFINLVLRGVSGDLNAQQEEHLGRAYSAAQHLMSLLSDSVDLAKIELGKMETVTTEFKLKPALEAVINGLQSESNNNPHPLSLSCEPNVMLHSDERLIQQCVRNLLRGAIDSGDIKNIQMSVSTDGKWVTIAVTDHGDGIDTENLPYVFKAFDGLGVDRQFRGSAIQLALHTTKRIAVELLQGNVAATCKVGSGTTYTISIPCDKNGGGRDA